MTPNVPLIGRPAPPFDLPGATSKGPGTPPERCHVTLTDYTGRWLIVMFYPHDFSMVCPTELMGLGRRFEEFQDRGCEVLAVSCDSVGSHLEWLRTPPERGGVAGLPFPLASDDDGAVARAYGVFLDSQKVALRGLFIIDPNGVLQYQAVHNLSVGRRTDDVQRILGAIQSGGTCGERWESPLDTIDPARLLVPGYRLGSFEIVRLVGSGTFATVYLAHDVTLDRPVALKVFRPNTSDAGTRALAEARSVAALSHPNVCAIYGVNDALGYPIIAMEYVDGTPLRDLFGAGPLPPWRAALLGRQVAEGLAAAHARGVIHGDLKPENVMVTPADQVKILDFGLSRRRAVGASDETLALGPADAADTGGLFGTPGYFAPEQALGLPATEATDVFSLGLLLHEMLTGRRAFAGSDLIDTLDRVRRADPLALADEVPPPFAALLRNALQPDPARRTISMTECARALGEALGLGR